MLGRVLGGQAEMHSSIRKFMFIISGPGCSSSMGLLMELGEQIIYKFRSNQNINLFRVLEGPCSIDMQNLSANGTVWNPYSWNEEANIFFLDQP